VHRLLPVTLLIVFLLPACAARRELPRLSGGWDYALGGAQPPAQWHDEVTPDGVRDFWMRAALPESNATHLVVRAYVPELEVFVDGRRVYSFRDARAAGHMALHVIPLRPGRYLYIRVPRAPDVTMFGGAAYLATPGTLPLVLSEVTAGPLRDDSSDLVLGLLLFVIGVVAAAASLIRRRGDVLALRWFGLFTLLYGTRLVVDSYLPLLLGASIVTMAYLEAFITYVIPVASWTLPMRLIGTGWKSTLRIQVILFAIFAPVGIASDLINRHPGSLESVNNVLVVTGLVNILFNLLRIEQKTHELRVVLAGSLAFAILALGNNLTALGILPWSFFSNETIGFVLFVAALGYAAMRAFTRGERERILIDNELTTAREIQRSILPRAMPEVAGLRVSTGYDPASSVAGDLYDFLTVDSSRAGVLVADVAGHGVPAALIASMVKIAFSSQARLADDPAALLSELNAILRRDVRRAFVTATYLWFDMTARTVTVCNAGHAPPLLYRDGAFLELGGAGVLLGRFASVTYTAVTTPLQSGDRIVACTDGLIEARNTREEQFGEDRLRALIARNATVEQLLAEVHTWRRGTDAAEADDLTVVAMEVSGER
jgi:sigma-B regulation protein RsbU (phosphoserine phosphatase)